MKKEFYQKFGITVHDLIEEAAFLGALDKLYLEFTEEQAVGIVKFFYQHADDINNEFKEEANTKMVETLAEITKALQSSEEEDEKTIDKTSDA